MSRTETQNFFVPPVGAKAALFFLEGHYQFNYLEGDIERTKFLTPSQIGKAFSVKDVFDSGWLETNIIRFALGAKKKHKILSVLPSRRRKIFVTDPRPNEKRESDGENTSGDSAIELEVPLPALLLLGCGKEYYLWATLDKVISQKSRICAAPLPNLDGRGSICFGKNAAPECSFDCVESVWRLIFDSPFNNHQAANRCRTYETDVRKLLFELDGKKTFPKNALIKTNHTVGDLWQSVR